MIYFIEAVGSGRVKIGRSTNTRSRLRSLSTGCPFRLRIIGEMDGDDEAETAIHAAFSKFRLSGEWFSLSPEIRAFIDAGQVWARCDHCGTEYLVYDRSGITMFQIGEICHDATVNKTNCTGTLLPIADAHFRTLHALNRP